MISRIWTKRQTQATIKALRAAGYEVAKMPSGYSIVVGDTTIFKAMVGSHGYLVRFTDSLFCEGV